MMQTTRTRQRVARLTSATAVVCDALALYSSKPEPWDSAWPWEWQKPRSNMTAAQRAHSLLQRYSGLLPSLRVGIRRKTTSRTPRITSEMAKGER